MVQDDPSKIEYLSARLVLGSQRNVPPAAYANCAAYHVEEPRRRRLYCNFFCCRMLRTHFK